MPSGGKREGSGRKAVEFTEQERQIVEIMAAGGFNNAEIAAAIKPGGVDVRTLRKHCAHELENGAAVVNGRLVRKAYQKAIVDGDTTMIIWLTKTRLGWKETTVRDVNVTHRRLIEMTDEEILAQLDEHIFEDDAGEGISAARSGQNGSAPVH
jgi:hypothetical protein